MNKFNTTLLVLIIVVVIAGIGVVFVFNQKGDGHEQAPDGSKVNQESEPYTTGVKTVTNKINTSDWLTYSDEDLGIEIKHPNDMMVLKGNDKNPLTEMTGIPDSITVCYHRTNDSGEQVCGFYSVRFEFNDDVEIKNSLEGFDYMYSLYKERRAEHDIGPPRLLNLEQVGVNEKMYYQAGYFGGDSKAMHVYIPHKGKLLTYNFDIYPIENDPETELHQLVAYGILSSLKLYK